MEKRQRIAQFRSATNLWRRHLPPGSTIRGYTCDAMEAMIDRLEAIEDEMDRAIGRLNRASADFEATVAVAESWHPRLSDDSLTA